MPARTHKSREHAHRAERPAIDLVCVLRGARARPPKEDDAEDANETGRRERRRQGEQRADRRHQKFQPPLRQLRAEQDRLKDQPFGGEAVQRRQRRNGGAGDQEQ